MRFIGITGGAGAGKTAILSYLAKKADSRVLLADEIAHDLMQPGSDCYRQIVERFAGEDIFCGQDEAAAENVSLDGQELRPFDRGKLAQVIFSNEEKRTALNAIVHPAVKAYVRQQYQKEKQEGKLALLFLEAALLIEEKYDEICDELWYIYTSEENRRKRLMESRGYSQKKIDDIFKSQLSEKEFRKFTQVSIDNNGDLGETYMQIESALRRKSR